MCDIIFNLNKMYSKASLVDWDNYHFVIMGAPDKDSIKKVAKVIINL